jgi:hypothetical protein
MLLSTEQRLYLTLQRGGNVTYNILSIHLVGLLNKMNYSKFDA